MFTEKSLPTKHNLKELSQNIALKASLEEALICVCDCEATGIDTEKDDVIEVTVAMIQGDKELGRFSSLVRPEPIEYSDGVLQKYWKNSTPPKYVPESVTDVTGISDEEISNAPSSKEVSKELISFLKNTLPEHLPNRPEGIVWGTYFGKMEQGYLKKLIGAWAPTDENTFCIKSLVRKLIEEGVLPLTQEELGNELETFTTVVTGFSPSHAHHRSSGDVDMTTDSIRAVFKKGEFRALNLGGEDSTSLNTSFSDKGEHRKTIGELLRYQGSPIQTPWALITDNAATIISNQRKWNEITEAVSNQKFIPLSAIKDKAEV